MRCVNTKIIFMSVVLILSATVSVALPDCKSSYNYKTWTDCIGTITYSTGRKSVGEYKNGNRVRFSTGSTEPVKLSSLKPRISTCLKNNVNKFNQP